MRRSWISAVDASMSAKRVFCLRMGEAGRGTGTSCAPTSRFRGSTATGREGDLIEPRLAASVLASALLRLADGEGGFGAIIAKGDATAGTIAIILTERGVLPRLYERLLRPDGSYAWIESLSAGQDDQDLQILLERRRLFDPDLWIIELDVPSAERFAAEMNSMVDAPEQSR